MALRSAGRSRRIMALISCYRLQATGCRCAACGMQLAASSLKPAACGPVASVGIQFMQAVVADSKKMRNLVEDRAADLGAQRFPAREIALQRLLKDRDQVRQQRAAADALGQRDALVQAVQS